MIFLYIVLFLWTMPWFLISFTFIMHDPRNWWYYMWSPMFWPYWYWEAKRP